MEIKTDLDAFNFVVEKLLEQNCKSVDHDETCSYRGYRPETIEDMTKRACELAGVDYMLHEELSDYMDYFNDIMSTTPPNAKCAVGHLISDVHYKGYVEGDGLNHDVFEMVQKSHPNWIIDDEEESQWHMLADLQRIHDSSLPSEWPNDFEKMSKKFVNEKYHAELRIIDEQ